MQEELNALEKNDTWELTELPHGKGTIGSKWVYKIKLKLDGTVDRLKVRLVAKGYHQVVGVDYKHSFLPVAKLVTLKLFLAITAAKGWYIHQLDVNNAFLHGSLVKGVYMQPPDGYNKVVPNQVFKLKMSLYGLKQASR